MIAVFLLVPALTVGCSTPEQQFQSDSEKFQALAKDDFAGICGHLGEIVLERGEVLRNNSVSASVSSASVTNRTDERVDAEAYLRAGATGYRSGLLKVYCGFDPRSEPKSDAPLLIALAVEEAEYPKAALARINAMMRAMYALDIPG